MGTLVFAVLAATFVLIVIAVNTDRTDSTRTQDIITGLAWTFALFTLFVAVVRIFTTGGA